MSHLYSFPQLTCQLYLHATFFTTHLYFILKFIHNPSTLQFVFGNNPIYLLGTGCTTCLLASFQAKSRMLCRRVRFELVSLELNIIVLTLLFNKALNSNIPSTIQEQVQEQLDSLDLYVPIGASSYNIFINFLMKKITFNPAQQWLSLGTAAEFTRKGIAPFPLEPISLPDRAPNNTMIQVFLTDWSISTAGYAFYYTDVFKQVIKWSDLPKGMQLLLEH